MESIDSHAVFRIDVPQAMPGPVGTKDETHWCTVTATGDPEELLGVVPDAPLPCWGWGSIPDQYGRRWRGDDGESAPPPVYERELQWTAPQPAARVDRQAVRTAVAQGSVDALAEALTGVELEPALQQVGAALLTAYRTASRKERERLTPLLVSVHSRSRRARRSRPCSPRRR